MALVYWGPVASAYTAVVLIIVWGQLLGAPRPFCRGKVFTCGWAIFVLSNGAAVIVSVCWLIVLGVRIVFG